MFKSSIIGMVLILISMVIALPCSADSNKLIFSCDQEIGPNGPSGKFLLYQKPAFSNYMYQLVVIINGTGKFTCDLRSGVSLSTTGAISVLDIDDDGYKDVRILGGHDSKSGKSWYKEWLFDPEKRTFVFKG